MEKEIIIHLGSGVEWGTNPPINKLLLALHNIPVLGRVVRKALLRCFQLPSETTILKGFWCMEPGNLRCGRNVSLADTFILNRAMVSIGDKTSFSYRNMIITTTHSVDDFNTLIARPVTIGSHVWVTSGCIILPGVTIGDHTVIGAGSVVTRDVPAGVLAAGNPCRPIRKIDFKK